MRYIWTDFYCPANRYFILLIGVTRQCKWDVDRSAIGELWTEFPHSILQNFPPGYVLLGQWERFWKFSLSSSSLSVRLAPKVSSFSIQPRAQVSWAPPHSFFGPEITKLLLVSEDTKLPAWSIRPVQASRGVSAAGWMVQGAREDLDWHRSSHRMFKYLNKMLAPIIHISQRSLIKESFEWWHGVGVLLVANCEVAWGKYVDIISVPLFTDVRRQRFSGAGILSCMQMQIRVKRRRIWRREWWAAVKEFVQRTRISHKKVADIHSGASVCQEIKMSKLTGFPLLCPLPYSDRCR